MQCFTETYFSSIAFYILYINDLRKVSNILEPITFTDDTNLFFSHESIKELFHTVSSELSKVFAWPNANKISPNKDKTKYALVHKARKKNSFINTSIIIHKRNETKRVSSTGSRNYV